jgi:hypothetical protein
MPAVLTIEGFTFYFFSNDHLPAHIHVRNQSGRAKFLLEPVVELASSKRMKVSEVNRAFDLVREHRSFLIQAFHDYERTK